MSPVEVTVIRLPHGADLPLPQYQSAQAAGLDLLAAVTTDVVIAPGQRAMVPTGIAIALPPGSEAQVRPRSGLAARHGITVLNTPGTVDADYRGEIQVILINFGDAPYVVQRGARIAQLVIAPVLHATLAEDHELAGSKRGSGGFGSTGTGEDSMPGVLKEGAGAAAPSHGRGRIYRSITETIGDTPLVRLDRLAQMHDVKATILAKLEFFNPIGSV